jgi:hypothetical protein
VWENIKTSNYRYLLIVGIIILLCAGICGWWYYESSRAKADYHDINSGLERIENRMDRAETGLSATQAEIYNAESELRGAAEAAGSIADKTRKNREILDECNDIINRSEERTARIEVIIRRVEERNEEYGAQADSRT